MRAVVLALLALSACAAEEEPAAPLSPVMIRQDLVGRTVTGTEDGGRFYLHFQPNGVAIRDGYQAEYGQWRVDETKGLCLRWHDQAETCTPVYQEHIGRYRLGDTAVNVFGPR